MDNSGRLLFSIVTEAATPMGFSPQQEFRVDFGSGSYITLDVVIPFLRLGFGVENDNFVKDDALKSMGWKLYRFSRDEIRHPYKEIFGPNVTVIKIIQEAIRTKGTDMRTNEAVNPKAEKGKAAMCKSGQADFLTDAYRNDAMFAFQHRLEQAVKLIDDLNKRGYRNERERTSLAALKPSLVDAHNKAVRLNRNFNQAESLKRSRNNENMTACQKTVCDILLSERLPANAFYRYVVSHEPRQTMDFSVPDKRIAIFCDRKGNHEEKIRDHMAALHGWTTIRFSEYEITERSDEVRHTIRKVMGIK